MRRPGVGPLQLDETWQGRLLGREGGGADLARALEHHLGVRLDDPAGNGMWGLQHVSCLGACGQAPVLVVDGVMQTRLPVDEPESLMQRFTDAGLPLPVGSPGYPLGSDQLGRGMLPRLAYGARVSLLVALTANLTSMALGVLVALLAGFYGRVTEGVLLRLADISLALPATLAALVLAAYLPAGLFRVIVITTVLFWAYPARLLYGEVLRIRRRTFIEAAEAAGLSGGAIVRRHVLPHLWPLIVTYAPLNAAAAVLFEATLSFLGAGIDPPTPSWGNMIAEGESSIFFAPHLLIEPAALILLATLAFLLIGEGLKSRTPDLARVSWLGA